MLPARGSLLLIVSIACALVVGVSLPRSLVANGRLDQQVSSTRAVVVSMTECCAELAWPELERALRDELTVIGLDAETVPGRATDETAQREELNDVAAGRGAAAALRIYLVDDDAQRQVELWIADRVTGKTTSRRIPVESHLSDALTVVAVRAVETLRASLLELRMLRTDPPADPAPPEIDALVEEIPLEDVPLGMFSVGARGQVAGSPGGARVRGGFTLGLGWLPLDALQLEVAARFGLLGADVGSRYGSASFDYALLGGWALWNIPAGELLHPAVGVGGGALIAWVEGNDDGTRPARGDTAQVGYVGGTARLGIAVLDHVLIVVGGAVGLTLPEVEVVRDGHQIAAFGRPLLEGELGLEVRFP